MSDLDAITGEIEEVCIALDRLAKDTDGPLEEMAPTMRQTHSAGTKATHPKDEAGRAEAIAALRAVDVGDATKSGSPVATRATSSNAATRTEP